MKEFERILIVRLGAVGDVVNVLPALHALRNAFPSAHISWLVEERAKDILYDSPDLNSIIVLPRKRWQKRIVNPITCVSTIIEAVAFLRMVRGKGFDLVIDFHGNLKSGLLTMASGGIQRLGFDRKSSKEWNYLFTNRHLSLVDERIHRIDKNLALLKLLGIDGDYTRPQIVVSPQDRKYVTDFLDRNNEAGKRLITIHPGTSEFGKFKRWPLSRYAGLADMLIDKLNAAILFTWGPSELEMVNEIVSLMERRAIVACRTRSLKQLAEIIRQSTIFIAGDTGPMHIASLLGTPIVTLFGPKDPVIYGPYAYSMGAGAGNMSKTDTNMYGTVRVVRNDIECSPCKKRSCNGNDCINGITVDEVFRATSDLLGDVIHAERLQ